MRAPWLADFGATLLVQEWTTKLMLALLQSIFYSLLLLPTFQRVKTVNKHTPTRAELLPFLVAKSYTGNTTEVGDYLFKDNLHMKN